MDAAGSHLVRSSLMRLIALLALCVGVAACDHANPDASTAARLALGQKIFNDPRLSADGKIHCASCHKPDHAYTDGRPVSVGVFGRAGTRNTPSLMFIGRSEGASFFWDGRRQSLEQAVLDPFVNPVEMGLDDKAQLINRLKRDPAYRSAFAASFPGTEPSVTDEHLAVVLAAYVRSLDTRTSAYDLYASGRNPTALSTEAQLGLAIFKGKGQCSSCHLLKGSPAPLTDHSYHRAGVGLDGVDQNLPALTEGIVQRSLHGAALGNRIATHTDESQLGRFNVTLNPADIGLFRTPSLRGVGLTAPYMHDGSVPTLDEAIDREVYYRSLQSGQPLNLTVQEKQELRAFLETL